jgi:hypothetical protein
LSFAKKPSRPAAKTLLRAPQARFGWMLRLILFALVAIAGAAWALVRHYTHPLAPLRVPVVPSAAPIYDADAGEIPVPETIPEEPRR